MVPDGQFIWRQNQESFNSGFRPACSTGPVRIHVAAAVKAMKGSCRSIDVELAPVPQPCKALPQLRAAKETTGVASHAGARKNQGSVKAGPHQPMPVCSQVAFLFGNKAADNHAS